MKVKTLLVMFLLLMFTSSVIYMIDGIKVLQRPVLALSLAAILLLVISRSKLPALNIMSLVYYLFVLSCLFSAYLNQDVELMIGSLLFAALYIVLTVTLPAALGEDTQRIVAKTILISHLPFVFVSLAMDGFTTIPFAGVFYTGNAMGSVLATIYAVVLAVLVSQVEGVATKTKSFGKSGLALSSGIVLLMYLTFISGSRTSAISVITITAMALLFVAVRMMYTKKLKAGHLMKAVGVVIVGMPILFLVNFVVPIWEAFDRAIISKFLLKEDDVLDMRGDVWADTFSSAGLFGGGRDFFITETSAAALNTYISVLGQYGWLALVFFVGFTIIATVHALQYMIHSEDDQYRYLPVLMIGIFLLLSTAESMMMKTSMLAMYVAAAPILSRERKSKRSQQYESGAIIERERVLNN